MTSTIDRNGLEVIPRAECISLLEAHSFGRLAVSRRALPTIVPVSYWCDGRNVFVRTGAGTKLDAAVRNEVVAFEIDDIGPVGHAGWSVAVTGLAREVVSPDERGRVMHAPLARWAPGEDGHVVAISLELVSGRRLRGGVVHPPTRSTTP